MKVYRIETRRQTIETEIDESDLITISDAADLRGVTIPSITSMLDTGSLPSFTLTDREIPGVRNQRLTSRRALMALPPDKKAVKRDGRGHKPSVTRNEAYISAVRKSAKAARELEAVPA